jgi:hypothetical protein
LPSANSRIILRKDIAKYPTIKFQADTKIPSELFYPLLTVAFVIEIVLVGTSLKKISSWGVTLIPLIFFFLALINNYIIKNGSYYLIKGNRLIIHSGLLMAEEIFIHQINKIDQDYESFAKIYRATFVELSRTSLKIRLKNGKRIIVAPLN